MPTKFEYGGVECENGKCVITYQAIMGDDVETKERKFNLPKGISDGVGEYFLDNLLTGTFIEVYRI